MEVVLDVGRAPTARFGPAAAPAEFWGAGEPGLAPEELAEAVAGLEAGGLEAGGLGLSRLSHLRNRQGQTVGLTLRVGRAVVGSSDPVADLFEAGASVLLLGPPGAGKTTTLRDACRRLAASGRRVVAVDSQMELGGHGDVPDPALGLARRLPVPNPAAQHRVILEAVLNHSPEVLVVDQISGAAEAAAVRDAAERGVQLVASAHGRVLGNVLKDPILQDIVGGVRPVTVGDEAARLHAGHRKVVLERARAPTFTVAVEMEMARAEWRVHRSVVDSVDALLAQQRAPVEVRTVGAGEGGGGGACASVAKSIRFTVGSPQVDLGLAPWDSQSRLFPGAVRPAEARGLLEEALSEEAAADEKRAPPPRAPKLRPRNDAVRVWGAHSVEPGRLRAAVDKLQLGRDIRLVDSLEEADAALALRSEFKADRELQLEVERRGLPVFTIRSSAGAKITKALKALMTHNELGGGGWGESAPEPALGEPAVGAGGAAPLSSLPEAEEEAVGLAVKACIAADQAGYRAACRCLSGRMESALSEVRNAVEHVVLKRHMPVELAVQRGSSLLAQERLCRAYDLDCMIVSSEKGSRLRVLPDPALASLLAQAPQETAGRGAGAGQPPEVPWQRWVTM